MKNLSIFLSIIIMIIFSSCDKNKTFRNIYPKKSSIILKKYKDIQNNKKVYVFNGISSDWYGIEDDVLFDKLNVGDTLSNVIIHIHTYYEKDCGYTSK